MTNHEINEYIAVEIMGRCLSDSSRTAVSGECEVCGELRPSHVKPIPDYCSDASPRSLLNEVVAKVAAPNSYSHFEDTLLEVINRSHPKSRTYNNGYWSFLLITATAEQIARACVEAHKERV